MNRASRFTVLRALESVASEAHVLVEALDRDALHILCEVALNVIIGNIPSNEEQLSRLRRFKKDLLLLTDPLTKQASVERIVKRPGLVANILAAAKPVLR